VALDFLNFTTLRRRHYYLNQELLLNRRLCPEIYLAVLPVTASREGVRVGGRGQVVDYVLKMARLPQEGMMDEVAARGELTLADLDRLVAVLAPFYRQAATGPHINRYGEPAVIAYNHEENFARMKAQVGKVITRELFESIRDFARGFLVEQRPLLRRRLREGRIRDCHGDLHLRNLCRANGIYVFDCIEFNPRFRYGDVAADVAFLAMDLDFHGLPDCSRHFAAACQGAFKDPELPLVLNFYKCYRACVRGKISALAASEPEMPPAEGERAQKAAQAYFRLAATYLPGEDL